MLRGSIQCRSVWQKWRTVKALDINLFNSLAMDSYVKFEKDRQYQTLDIHFKPELVKKVALKYPKIGLPFLEAYHRQIDWSLFNRDVRANAAIIRICNNIITLASNNSPSCLLDQEVEHLLLRLFLFKSEIEQRRALDGNQKRIIEGIHKASTHIIKTYERFRGLSYFSRLANTNKSYFQKFFKQETGQTIFAFHQLTMLQKGLYMLLTTPLPVQDIAFQSGYSSASGFIKAFKKYFEISPDLYRKKMGKHHSHANYINHIILKNKQEGF